MTTVNGWAHRVHLGRLLPCHSQTLAPPPLVCRQVRTLLRVAGSVRRLLTVGAYVAHLELLPLLEELFLCLGAADPFVTYARVDTEAAMLVDLTCLASLTSLQSALFMVEEPAIIHGLHDLSSLSTLVLHGAIPTDLPVSLTQLAIAHVQPVEGDLFHAFVGGLITSTRHDTLSNLTLPMHLLSNHPNELQALQGVRHVADLHLVFSLWEENAVSSWCPGFFGQLQVLHLELDRCSFTASPAWDFSTCSSLKSFSISICGIRGALQLDQLKNVCTELLVVEFKSWECDRERLCLCCGTWTIGHAEIRYIQADQEELPCCVSDVLGALQSAKSGPPMILVNGMSPTAAAAAAVANHSH